MEKKLQIFIDNHEQKIIPPNINGAKAYSDASISGKAEDYQKAADLELQLNRIYANKDEFAELKEIKESQNIKDPILKRQLDILYNTYLSKQVDDDLLEEIIQLQTENEKQYAIFRAKVNEKSLTDNEIDDILKKSKDTDLLEKVWFASKKVGKLVETDVLNLVRLRNKSAHQLGFDNYHSMSLILSEQDPLQLDNLFDDLEKMTNQPFMELKNEIDDYLSKLYNIKRSNLKPWHYQNRCFQEAPEIFNTNLDKHFKKINIEDITKQYFSTINLPIDELLEKSDLYEKSGKYQHAYCMDVDRSGDVRVVCNIKPNADWMGTMLHEFGHAVYDKYNDSQLPWLLRTHAHVFTTEAIAMFFGRLTTNPLWLKKYINIKELPTEIFEKNIQKSLVSNLLVFSRWTQVMYRFEKHMYENPEQNLNNLWWDLVEKYQGIQRPDKPNGADWAAKVHTALYPAYYHNYMLGEIFASQIIAYINRHIVEIPDDYSNNQSIGKYLKENIFSAGNRYHWSELIEKATGESLTPKYFTDQVVKIQHIS